MSIEKVAKLAGVSNSTVSRVINNHPRVAPETKRAVQQAMEQLSYSPSARRPGRKPQNHAESVNIGFLVLGAAEGSSTPGFSNLLRGVSANATRSNLHLTFSHLPLPDNLPGQIAAQRFSGVLLHGAIPTGDALEGLQSLPTVWLMGNRQAPTWGDRVMPDIFAVGEIASRHLIGEGHQRLAYMNLDDGHWALHGYGVAFVGSAVAAGREVHLLSSERMLVPKGYWQPYRPEAVKELVDRFVTLPERPSGLLIADSMQAAMLQPALQKAGVTIGEGGVQILTCNNEDPYLMGLNPRPFVIDTRIEAVGRRGIDQLIWRMSHPDEERISSTVEPRLKQPPAGAAAVH